MPVNKARKLKTYTLALIFISAIFVSKPLFAQPGSDLDLLDGMDDGKPKNENVTNEFKTSTVINLQSLMMTAPGEWDFKINHRFGALNSGAYEAFGLDNSNVRIGGEFGISPKFNLGIARSGFQKMTDIFAKYKVLNQTTNNAIPITVIGMFSTAYTAQKLSFSQTASGRDVNFQTRLAYTGQLIIGRKFSKRFTAQISPGLVHYNMAPVDVDNTLYALGLAARYKLTNRSALNLEYIPVLGNKGAYHNSFSIGFDIETGGHVFQLHLTNSLGMAPNQFIARNTESWGDGGVHFGFNISRIFSLKRNK